MSSNKAGKKLTGVGRINRRERPIETDEPKPWWRTSRRKFIVGTALAAGAVVTGGIWLATRDDTSDVDKDSLELQKAQGWNVGSEDKMLSLPGAQTLDSTQSNAWPKYLDQSAMLTAYQPKSQQWMPYFVPTLIQSLQFETLRQQLKPIFLPDMQEAYERGRTIGKDFLANAENPSETVIIADLPGRDSVAFGAGMSEFARLVLTFDNFPHPLGVTPSHETLAAMLYYAAEIETKQGAAKENAPAVFLLDSKRLEPYKDEDTQFDNRYLAKLPSADRFKEMGVKSLVYLVPDRTRTEEMDDLNEDFVDYKDKGLNVAILPLSDLMPVNETVTKTGADGSTQTATERRYYYGGSPGYHPFFFYSYPFYRPYPSYASRYPGLSGARAPAISPPRYVPTARPTMFSGTRIGRTASGVGRSKPSGFGRTTVRVNSSGGIVGTRSGRSGYYGRSGSLGRGGGGSG